MERRYTVLTRTIAHYAADDTTRTPAGIVRLRLYNDGSTHAATATVIHAVPLDGHPDLTLLALAGQQARDGAAMRRCVVATAAWEGWVRTVAAAGDPQLLPRVVLRRAAAAAAAWRTEVV